MVPSWSQRECSVRETRADTLERRCRCHCHSVRLALGKNGPQKQAASWMDLRAMMLSFKRKSQITIYSQASLVPTLTTCKRNDWDTRGPTGCWKQYLSESTGNYINVCIIKVRGADDSTGGISYNSVSWGNLKQRFPLKISVTHLLACLSRQGFSV